MNENALIAIMAFVVSVVAGVAALMWGDRRVAARREELVEGGDWEGLFPTLGMTVAPGQGGGPARAVGLGGRLEVSLPCASIADLEAGMSMRFRLDLTGRVHPSLLMVGSARDYDHEKQTYRGVSVKRYEERGTHGELLDVQGDPVRVLCLSTTRLAWHVLQFHTCVAPASEISLRSGVFTFEPSEATFFLEEGGMEALGNVVGLMKSIDGAMSRRRGEADELLSLLSGDGRAFFMRVDAARMLLTRHSTSPVMAAAEEALVEMFTARPRADALKRVLASGWAPSPEETRRLCASGDRASREVLMRFISARDDVQAYAAALLTLRGAGIPGAAELADTLDLRAAHGGLSLAADDAARGALSQAAERGGLTDAEG